MTALRYPPNTEARRVATEAEIIAAIARAIAAGEPLVPGLLARVAAELTATAARIARLESALDEPHSPRAAAPPARD